MNLRSERFGPEIEIEISKAEKENSYEILVDPEIREELKLRVERLLDSVHDQGVESLIFLDRSARPISWLFRDLWKQKFPNEKRPDIKFANIGKPSQLGHKGIEGTAEVTREDHEKWLEWNERTKDFVDNGGWLGVDDMAQDMSQWVEKENAADFMKKTFGKSFDGKKLLIVDDFFASGKTLTAALTIFSEAFDQVEDIKATAINTTTGSIEGDKERMPWLRESGMAGILEDVGDELLSKPINSENLKKIKGHIQEKIEIATDSAVDAIQKLFENTELHELVDQLDDFIEDDWQENEGRLVLLKAGFNNPTPFPFDTNSYFYALENIGEIYQDFLEKKSIEEIDLLKFFDNSSNLRFLNDKLEEYGPKSRYLAEAVRESVLQIGDFFYDIKHNSRILEMELWDVQALKKKAQTLRKELKKLAIE